MIRYYPSFSHLMKEFSVVGGNQCGITQGFAVPVVDFQPEPYLRAMTGKMPHYHRLILEEPTKDMQYHLSGYGIYNEEAFVKFMGESIERYSTVVSSKLVEDRVVYASYEDMIKRGTVMPLDYINIYSDEQQKKIGELIPQYSSEKAKPTDIIGWVECPSLFNPQEKVWVPSQMLFVGFKRNEEVGEKMYVPSFSTGTAAHITLQKALLNALIEYVQIDAFIINWYTKRLSKKVIIDDETVLSILEKVGHGKDSVYELIPLYYTLADMPVPIFGVFLKRKEKKIPYMVFGTQGDLDAANGLMRGVMESTAIIALGIYNALLDTETYHMAVHESAYTDLDTNVLLYASQDKIEEKEALLNSFIHGEINVSDIETMRGTDVDEQIGHIIKHLSYISKYAVYMDLTPPEVTDKGWHVVRVFIPEICGMCLPGLPFKEHPRIKKYGGVKNEYPHPLP